MSEPPQRPLPPVVQHAIRMGLGVAARATARFVDSVLKDVGEVLHAGERSVQRRRENINQKVRDSGVGYDDDAESDR